MIYKIRNIVLILREKQFSHRLNIRIQKIEILIIYIASPIGFYHNRYSTRGSKKTHSIAL